jgi:hypothetical protein
VDLGLGNESVVLGAGAWASVAVMILQLKFSALPCLHVVTRSVASRASRVPLAAPARAIMIGYLLSA